MNTTPANPGSFVDDAQRYRLDERIATGGMGEVWKATDTVLGREVAVKLLKGEYADDSQFRSRFETEARNAAALHHPNVAGVFDFGEASATDGSRTPRPYLVMEYVQGAPLSDLLRDGREMDPRPVRDLLAQAGDALGAAHAAGIVHRDVKPANLMVTPDKRIKITDFGIARAADGVGITQTGAVMGTPQYLSPEQARGERASAASDVYSLGVVAFECLTGRRPFEADSPVATALAHLQQPVPELPDDIPADLAAVVRRALSKVPTDRYLDGSAFAEALRDPATAVLSAPPVPSSYDDGASTRVMAAAVPVAPTDPEPTVSTPVAAPDSNSRNAWAIALVVLLLVAVAVLATVLLTQGDDEADPAEPDRTRSSQPEETEDPTEEPPPTSEPTEEPTEEPTPEPDPIDLNPDDYVGNDVDQVESDLESLGLDTQREELDNLGTEEENTVDSISPTDGLQEGDTVTVSFWGPPPVEGLADNEGDQN